MILKKILRIAVLAVLAGPAKGQGTIIYGRIRDTVLQRNCANAIVTLFQNDSVLVEKTTSNAYGYFKFKSAIPFHYYTLQVVHPAFEIYRLKINIPNSDFFDLGSIFLRPKSDTLTTAMVIRNPTLPKFKGDTLEYNTENIQLRPFARVEDLLQLLPGLQIDADGNIFYDGTRIRHLLIDGEEVIGSSPTLITKNLNGNKIARVQILDRKSDRTIFTGVDDGTRAKTINLVLKDSDRHTYSGNIELGGDDNGYYNSTAFLASFRGKEQIAAVGLASNVGNKSAADNKGSVSNGIVILNQTIDPLGAVAGPGIPEIIGGALHYANTWKEQKEHVNGGYQCGYIINEPINTTQSIQTLPDSIYTQVQAKHSRNEENQQKGNVKLDYRISSSSSFRFSFDGGYTTGQDKLDAAGSSMFNGVSVNSSERTIQANVHNQNITGDVGWRLNSKNRPARVFSIVAGLGKLDNVSKGYLYSNNTFFQPNGLPVAVDTTDQWKKIVDHAINYTADLTYTEPLRKSVVLAAEFKTMESRADPQQSTFALENGKYDMYIDSLSNQFNNRSITTQATINIQGDMKHLKYVFGGDWFTYNFRQKNVLEDTISSYRYGYLAPSMRLDFLVSPRFTFNIDYRLSTQLPTTEQLSPAVNNNDPLHLNMGNPSLKPAVNQNFNLNFTLIKSWMLFFNMNMILHDKSITTKTNTDSLGRQISGPVNVGGGKSAALYFGATRKVFDVNVGVAFSSSYIHTVNFVNSDISKNNSYRNSGGVSFMKNVRDKLFFQLATNFIFFDQSSSVNLNAPVRYWEQAHNGSASLYFIPEYEFNTNFDYLWQEKTDAFPENTATFIWNAYVRRSFIYKKLVVKVSINNVLNKNAGINRVNAENINTQTYNNILGRYWLLSVIYNFDRRFSGR